MTVSKPKNNVHSPKWPVLLQFYRAKIKILKLEQIEKLNHHFNLKFHDELNGKSLETQKIFLEDEISKNRNLWLEICHFLRIDWPAICRALRIFEMTLRVITLDNMWKYVIIRYKYNVIIGWVSKYRKQLRRSSQADLSDKRFNMSLSRVLELWKLLSPEKKCTQV